MSPAHQPRPYPQTAWYTCSQSWCSKRRKRMSPLKGNLRLNRVHLCKYPSGINCGGASSRYLIPVHPPVCLSVCLSPPPDASRDDDDGDVDCQPRNVNSALVSMSLNWGTPTPTQHHQYHHSCSHVSKRRKRQCLSYGHYNLPWIREVERGGPRDALSESERATGCEEWCANWG